MAIDWATEIGVHADEAALEAEVATRLDAEGSALTNRNALASFWSMVKKTVFAPILSLEALLVATAPMGFLRHSSGVWLVEKLLEFGKTIKAAATAQGNITFSRVLTSGNVNIPLGTIIATKTLADGTVKRFVTLADTVLTDGLGSVDVPAQAENEGIEHNVPDDALTELITPITGIDAVTNAAGWLVAAGVEKETDQAAVDRTLADQQSGGEGWIGGHQTYLSLANNFTGVVDGLVDGSQPRGQGSVDVIIIGGAGQPTQQLIDDLTAELEDRGNPITDNLLVKGPADVTVNQDVDAVALIGDARIDAQVKSDTEGVLDSLFTYGVGSNFLGLGEDYVRGQVARLCIDQAGLKTLRFTDPSADVAVPAGGLAVAGTRTVTVVREEP